MIAYCWPGPASDELTAQRQLYELRPKKSAEPLIACRCAAVNTGKPEPITLLIELG
jgi:hypothetical protein